MRISIKTKIYIAFFIILFFFSLNALYSIYTLNQNRKIMNIINYGYTPLQSALNEFKLLVKNFEMIYSAIVLNPEDFKNIDALNYLEKNEWNVCRENLFLATKRIDNSDLYKSIEELSDSFYKILMLQQKNINLFYRDGNWAVEKLDDNLKLELRSDYKSKISIEYEKLNKKLERIGKIVVDLKNEKEKELSKKSENFRVFVMVMAIGLVCLGLLFILYFSKSLIKSIQEISYLLNKISVGQLPDYEITYKTNDEIKQIFTSISQLIGGLKRTTIFAYNIGKGEFDAEFEPLSQNDTLGKALLEMRESLKIAAEKDEEQNQIVSTIAEVSSVLSSNESLQTIADKLIKYLCEKTNSVQGAFYIINHESPHKEIELLSAYAYNRKKYIHRTFKSGQGLVGQAVAEMDIIYRTEIPKEYVTIKSGLLGEKKPQSILIMPLITNDEVYGAVEFASIYKYTPRQLRLVREISEVIARSIFNIQVNERTRRLLEESQKMSAELKEQSIMLQQNAEEMEATQEELRRTNLRLEEQIKEVYKTQKKINVLLENSSEIIKIVDQHGVIAYVSPSVRSIAGYEEKELVSTQITNKIGFEYHEEFYALLENVIQNPKQTFTIEYAYKKKNGEYIWMEATAKNLLNDEAINGIVINSRDITLRKIAEKESRMRSQMQSLSENSPDLICRLGTDGVFYYVNPVIEKLTLHSKNYFEQKHFYETPLADTVKNEWKNILDKVCLEKLKISTEMVFPTQQGRVIMSVNAIPEFGEDQSLESILLVSSDITERKEIEIEIRNKNKNITESINYAKRIQSAILPDNDLIAKDLPDSFILYKPRDVVSGDFPWYMKKGDTLYIAAVDCTGHGVPGALLSLIGYFILNDIVKSQNVLDTGVILDLLDEGVTKTLRQDEKANTKDGMDISLVKIDKKNKILQYSGAHRPLYMVKKDEFLELKGDKFPIGGGKSKNQTNFTTHTIPFENGDAIYFCSDGYPDQFGGPENRKLSPSRIRSLIMENKNVPMRKMYVLFDEMFISWKGNQKQTDDVLVIGIRF